MTMTSRFHNIKPHHPNRHDLFFKQFAQYLYLKVHCQCSDDCLFQKVDIASILQALDDQLGKKDRLDNALKAMQELFKQSFNDKNSIDANLKLFNDHGIGNSVDQVAIGFMSMIPGLYSKYFEVGPNLFVLFCTYDGGDCCCI